MSLPRSSHDFDAAPSPIEAEQLVKRMSTNGSLDETSAKDDKVLKIATFSLQKYLKEPDFAAEFLERGGLESLCDIINKVSGNTLAYALNSFTSLMDHDASWKSLTPEFVETVAHIVASETLVTICRPATAILIKVVCAERMMPFTPPSASSTATAQNEAVMGYPAIHRVLQQEPDLLSLLIQRLQSPDYVLCLNSLTLLTSMLKYVTDDHRSELLEGIDNSNARKNVLRIMDNHPPEELKEQVLEFQSALIHNADRRRKTQISIYNPRHAKMLNNIWEAANVQDIPIPGAKKWRKLGFSSEVPHREFGRAGVFGLERMHTFVMQHKDLFAKMILEQIHRPDGRRCQFAKVSIEVTDLLCSYWNISTGYTAATFEPLLFHFEHVHATTLQLFFRLFQDMEATTTDFPKVSALVRSQLRATLKSDGVKDIFEFDRIMLNTPYTVIRDRRLKELEWADDLLGREAIRNLRGRLNRQSYDFVKRQRISCLLQGAWFPCPQTNQRMVAAFTNGAASTGVGSTNGVTGASASGNSSSSSTNAPGSGTGVSSSSLSVPRRWRYYKLSPSKKTLQYGDFNEKFPPVIKSFDKLTNKVDLTRASEIKPYRRKASNVASLSTLSDSTTTLSFALFSEDHIPLAEFICTSSAQASEWKDGFSMLLDKGITSKDTAEYLHSLTEIGVKVKLLQIAGDRIEVPHGQLEPPPVPAGLGTGFFYGNG
ncbi:related to engulfment and cell motility gene 1protein [Lichtheimia corymbifera JMRC:FSU:9682]|uniref:Related to engulfment and cell motility gene 1protein n=1 Tax=Lichtheimia corymbifera JMRC:FSU:9682 TaxID=1263082 RepID=A0A068RFR3_9FUNG|nr:related to engulfment and cell motility gene 1protein [Lichtheimia corymbifera JMRC:FSU:9682]